MVKRVSEKLTTVASTTQDWVWEDYTTRMEALIKDDAGMSSLNWWEKLDLRGDLEKTWSILTVESQCRLKSHGCLCESSHSQSRMRSKEMKESSKNLVMELVILDSKMIQSVTMCVEKSRVALDLSRNMSRSPALISLNYWWWKKQAALLWKSGLISWPLYWEVMPRKLV